MSSSQIRSKGADPAAKADGKNSGVTVDPGPYEAIVISHVASTKMGQLLVYIPDFGGEKTDPKNQIPVSYCSPYYGYTYGTNNQDTNPDAPDAQFTTGQSYGMWMVPPDVGNKVLVVFAAGDRGRGYWIGCIYDSMSHHMVPGLSRNVGSNADGTNNDKSKPPNPANSALGLANGESVSTVVEAYVKSGETLKGDAIKTSPRYVHEWQNLILVGQGLDKDKVRGAISSSSLRESPSNVYGISTPGRSVTEGAKQVSSTPAENKDQAIIARKGGHSFVMDDGDATGVDNLIRLRSSGGHQILMNDTEQILYIASANGEQWLEFSSDGSINVFATKGFNLRSKGEMNLHADKSINIHSGDTVNINGTTAVNVTSQTAVNVKSPGTVTVGANGQLQLFGKGGASLLSGAGLNMSSNGDCNMTGTKINMGGGSSPDIPSIEITTKSLQESTFNTVWQKSGTFESICSVAPAHEPWLQTPTKPARPNPV